MSDGGRCLNLYISRKGQRDHLGNFGGQDPRSDSNRFSHLWEMSREIGLEVGRYSARDFKRDHTNREGGGILIDLL